jgi:hypothetical protein
MVGKLAIHLQSREILVYVIRIGMNVVVVHFKAYELAGELYHTK